MTNHNFVNWEEAVLVIRHETDFAVIGALSMIHQGIQQCAGLPIQSISQSRLPNKPLDLYWFYQAVSSAIRRWKEGEISQVGSVSNLEREFIDSLGLSTPESVDVKVFNWFINTLSSLQTERSVDVRFCCWIFAETILSPGLLGGVLDGSIAMGIFEQQESFEKWAASWT